MAKKGRIGGRWLRPRLAQEIVLGALSTDTLISESSGGSAVSNRVRVASIDVMVGIHNHTAGEGPIVIGVAKGDYTDAEIQEWFLALAAWNDEDEIAREQSKRYCRVLGMLGGASVSERLWDGRQRKFRLNWSIGEGQSINFWAFNSDSNDLTTGSVVNVDGHANVRLGA